MREETRRRVSLCCNLFIAVMVPVAWFMMAFRDGAGSLSSNGLGSLKYFTVLSNLLCGAGALLYVSFFLRGKGVIPRPIQLLKFLGTASVGLTFLTVMLYLGPILGFHTMFLGANFWFHLVIPLVALVDMAFFDVCDPMSRRDILLAALPMLLYGAVYLGNNLIHGVGEWPNTNDWYGFLSWGLPVGLGIFAVLTALTCGVAALLRWGSLKRRGGAAQG